MAKISAYLLAVLGLAGWLAVAEAEVNPFKKTKDLVFADNMAWYFKYGSAIKSGVDQDGSEALYYHLIIGKDQLLLRLSLNDPSGELENTRPLDTLEIRDVLVDGQRLALFQWCLDNQAQLGKVLKQGAIVANEICTNNKSDFAIQLDDASRNTLAKARNVDFVIAPYGRPLRLTYSMTGFAKGYADIIKPEPPKAVAPPPAPVVEVKTAAPVPPPAPVVKTCHANAPDAYQSVIKAIAYPCGDKGKQASAEAKINDQVEAEKRKRLALEAERKRLEEEKRKEEESRKSREGEFEQQQAEMWIARCQKHWAQGKSPCYCAPYIDQAPPGVENNCGR